MKITNTFGISMYPQYVYFSYLRPQTRPLQNSERKTTTMLFAHDSDGHLCENENEKDRVRRY